MSVEKNAGNGTFAALYCAIFRTPSFRKSLKFFGTSIASLDPETVQLPAFYNATFTGACGPPEELSLALVLHLKVLRMIVILAYIHVVLTVKPALIFVMRSPTTETEEIYGLQPSTIVIDNKKVYLIDRISFVDTKKSPHEKHLATRLSSLKN